MNKAARKAVNLSVLKRHDPNIAEIIDTSSYVVVYQFDEASQSWTKKGVEGTMFVFTRSTTPSYGFYIMNRLSIDNFMVDLTGDLALQLTSDYIIYSDDQNIHGIWIYEPQDRDRIGKCLVDCCDRARQESIGGGLRSDASSSRPSHQQGQRVSQVNAQTQYQPQQHHHHQPQQEMTAATSVVQASSFTSAPEATDDPLSRMLAAAMTKAKVSESSGLPTTQGSDFSTFAEANNHQTRLNLQSTVSTRSIHSSTSASALSPTSPNGYTTPRPASLQRTSSETPSEGGSSKGNVPGFLLAILAKEQSNSPKQPSVTTMRSREGSFTSTTMSGVVAGATTAMIGAGSQNKGPEESRHQSLLDALTSRRDSQQSDYHKSPPPQQSRTASVLSAELLPPSVLPTGLYSTAGNNSSSNSSLSQQPRGSGSTTDMASVHPPVPPTGPMNGSPAPVFASTPILSRPPPNGMNHPSPMQMPMAPFMHGPPPPMFPPRPAPPFLNQSGGHQFPPPPPPPPPGPNMYPPGIHPPTGASFAMDALRASMGAPMRYLQQQQPDFDGSTGGDMLSRQEFAKRLLDLVQSDPQFVDAFYANYTAMLSRR